MSTWRTERGVHLYRPRLGPSTRPLTPAEPEFPWSTVPLMGLGFVVFFAGLALIAADVRAWEWSLVGAGIALVLTGFGLLARRFL